MTVGDTLSTGSADLRAENVNKAVIGFALQAYKFKPICLVQSGSSDKETYFKEGATELTAGGNVNLKGVPRLASFPYLEPTWEEANMHPLKHAGEGVVSWEDARTNEIDVMARTLLRVSRAIAKSVDDAIYAEWIGDADIGTAAITAGNEWDSLTTVNQNPILDMLRGNQNFVENNYDLGNIFILMSPKDHTNLMNNSKVINNPSFKTADVVSNGRVGQIVGGTIVVSKSVPADECLMIIGKTASTWKAVSPLKSNVIEDPGIKFTIRAWEIGGTMVTNPKAIYRITNTQKT